MTYRESPLRDLARKLRQTARLHPAYSQVTELMTLVDSHLSALAFAEETNARQARQPDVISERPKTSYTRDYRPVEPGETPKRYLR